VVWDFNPYEVQRVEKSRLSADDNLASHRYVVRDKCIDPRDQFYKDEVETSLPYVETVIKARERSSMQNILIDDGIVLHERYDEVR
jgi:hypothetical protein